MIHLKSIQKVVRGNSSMKRPHPHIFEINALVFLRRLSKKYESSLTLLTIPMKEWESLALQGFDYVWLMGVWKRSPEAKVFSLNHSDLKKEYDFILPGWNENDVSGSPYAVYDYSLDTKLGIADDLQKLRKKLAKLKLGLILDFVPNHLAIDHPFTCQMPAIFVEKQNPADASDLFFQTKQGRWLAYGKDPYFSPWKDTVQINFFSTEARKMAIDTLINIARQSDGVRCDMAMLALNEVFENTWGRFLGAMPRPQEEFWKEVIDAVKAQYPHFLFIAEAYWDMEWKLQQLGFDYTYDKKIYDRLTHASADEVRGHLMADLEYQNKSLRFIENHDEARAAENFGTAKSQAAAVVTTTIPGARLIHDGQIEAKSKHLSVHLETEPAEPPDLASISFYKMLMDYADSAPLHFGKWTLLNLTSAWENDESYRNLLAWSWKQEDEVCLIVVNFSGEASRGRVHVPVSWLTEREFLLKDKNGEVAYSRDAEEVKLKGLYVSLGPWKTHLFESSLKNRIFFTKKASKP